MENISLLDKALEYAQRGWYVFPCREKEGLPFRNEENGIEEISPVKSPYIRGGFKAATTDAEQIKFWWHRFPEAAIGIACGASNLVVVDIDTKGGRKGFDNFMNLNVSDSGALHSITQSGGMHIVYSGKTHSHANIKAGIDLRSEGAYFIVPPSFIYLNEIKRYYKALDDWNRCPIEVPSDLIYKLDILRKGERVKKENKRDTHYDESLDNLIRRARKALSQLPQRYCDDYFLWIDVGLALKTLGEAGFTLWDDWSKNSSKYDYKALKYRWDKFEPREITIASLFHWVKESTNGKN